MAESGPQTLRFDAFELDTARFELRGADGTVHVEPQVLSILILLARNGHRMVSRDELVETIWDGRIVSESAIAARIKAARKAIGDDGKSQRLIRTVHGKGFRFVGDVSDATPAPLAAQAATPSAAVPDDPLDGRPSIAVLPFDLQGESGPHDIVADALPADIIVDLARLRWLFVIARGSSFRFRGEAADPQAVGRALKVRYCLTGTIERLASEVVIGVSLVETGAGQAIWADQFRGDLRDMQALRPRIEEQVVSALELHIPQNELRYARARPAAELDAWASFHLGLDRMYRFTAADNREAAALFQHSLARDPYFSRALGGLSFTHFQNAFLRYEDDAEAEIEQAHAFAQRALEADRLDPFAHFSKGRCFWLQGQLDESIAWFDRSTGLSPNFAHGIYNRGVVEVLAGRAEDADRDLALALDLSPIDPLGYAMTASRAMAHIQLGDFEAAARLGDHAATMPGAHKHILLIAAFCRQLAGGHEAAQTWTARARALDADVSAADFFRAFPFAPITAREQIERSLRDLGL